MLTGPAVHLPLCDESFCRAAGRGVGWEQGVAASSPQPGHGVAAPIVQLPCSAATSPACISALQGKTPRCPMPTPGREVWAAATLALIRQMHSCSTWDPLHCKLSFALQTFCGKAISCEVQRKAGSGEIQEAWVKLSEFPFSPTNLSIESHVGLV